MFREMRRKSQMLSDETCLMILKESTSGVLAVSGDDGYPYAVPLSYVYENGSIYFHCALCGHKLDAVRQNEKASFCIIAKDQVVPEKYTTYYQSIIAFGQIRIVESEAKKREALVKLARKYAPDLSLKQHNAEIDRFFSSCQILELKIRHLTGKQTKELAAADEPAAKEPEV